MFTRNSSPLCYFRLLNLRTFTVWSRFTALGYIYISLSSNTLNLFQWVCVNLCHPNCDFPLSFYAFVLPLKFTLFSVWTHCQSSSLTLAMVPTRRHFSFVLFEHLLNHRQLLHKLSKLQGKRSFKLSTPHVILWFKMVSVLYGCWNWSYVTQMLCVPQSYCAGQDSLI